MFVCVGVVGECGCGWCELEEYMDEAVIKLGSCHLMATWVRRQHTEALNERNERLPAPLLRTHLHAVRFHYSWKALQELQDSAEPTFFALLPSSSYQADRHIGSPVHWALDSSRVKVFWSPPPPSSTSIFRGAIVGLPARKAGYRECLKLCFFTSCYNYCTARAPKSISGED